MGDNAYLSPISVIYVKGFFIHQKTITMNNPKYTKYKDTAGQYRFNLKAENGEKILHSEGYITSSGCDNGISSVKRNSPFDSRYDRRNSTNGQFYFVLKANNGEIIGTSETYTTSASRENGIEAVKRVGPIAPIDDVS